MATWSIKGYDKVDKSIFHVYEAPDAQIALDSLGDLYKDGYVSVEIRDPEGNLRDWNELRKSVYAKQIPSTERDD